VLEVDTRIRVRYQETDSMGVVHHSNYIVWFEIGRSDFLRAKGMSYRDVEKKGWMLPLIEVQCFYRQPARFDDMVVIRTCMKEFKGARLTMEYKIFRDEDGVLLAEGYTVHAVTDLNMKPVNLKRRDPEIYEFFMMCTD